jgi:hypothetical protein
MATDGGLMGLPLGAGVDLSLATIRDTAGRFGVTVVDDFSDTDHARFVGLFEGHTITLYPRAAPEFARWFTVAHLYGHMVQMANKTPRVDRANALVLRVGELLEPDDVQLIYDHEREAAEIGMRLVSAAEPDRLREMDVAYTRFFHADFRYLINVIETGERGAAMFAKYWKREPVPRELIGADARDLVDLHSVPATTERIIVV